MKHKFVRTIAFVLFCMMIIGSVIPAIAAPTGWSGWNYLSNAGDKAKFLNVDQNSDGTLHAFMIGMDDQIWHNVEKDVSLLQIGVTPHPVPINKAVTITVNATDLSTGSNVAGQVQIDGKVVANTNEQFSYTFKTKRKLVSVNPREWEITYPIGVVVASGYPEAPIDFGFPDV